MLVHFRYDSHVVPLYYRGSGRGVLTTHFIKGLHFLLTCIGEEVGVLTTLIYNMFANVLCFAYFGIGRFVYFHNKIRPHCCERFCYFQVCF